MRNLRKKSGFTLVELLVVVAVISLVTAISLPTIRDTIKSQRQAEASRIARAFIENARAKAILTGVSHGVVLERLGTLDSASRSSVRRMRLVSAPPRYSGDIEGAGCWLFHDVAVAKPLRAFSAAPNAALFSPQECPSLVRSANYYDDPSAFTSLPPIEVFDLLSLDGRQVVIESIEFCSSATDPPFISGGTTPYSQAVPGGWVKISFDPRVRTSGTVANGTYDAPDYPTLPVVAGQTPVRRTNFEIVRTKLRGGGSRLELPKGSVLDLTLSGMGAQGTEFSPLSIDSANAESVADYDYLPVSIVFGPKGEVENVFYGSLAGSLELARFRPTAGIHLLVGKASQVRADDLLANSSTGTSNLLDEQSTWISINPFNGRVSSSPVHVHDDFGSGTLSEAIFEARELTRESK